jgi:hypothetical protein
MGCWRVYCVAGLLLHCAIRLCSRVHYEGSWCDGDLGSGVSAMVLA